uniref:Uncharacterized protein n=1 Tax=Romanomermis culicivorax TaxID=13658 RepID=A0A915JBM9_ROMCU
MNDEFSIFKRLVRDMWTPDSPVNDDSSTFKSLLCMMTPSAGSRSPYLTMQISPTTNSPTKICICSPLRMTANLCSPSILACKPRNCFSFV